jgi:hypothetical protein
MTNEELIKRLREGQDLHVLAAERIEALVKERDEYFGLFVHWRKEADLLTKQIKATEVKDGSMSNFGSYELNWRRKNE